MGIFTQINYYQSNFVKINKILNRLIHFITYKLKKKIPKSSFPQLKISQSNYKNTFIMYQRQTLVL